MQDFEIEGTWTRSESLSLSCCFSHMHWKTEVKEKLLKEKATGLMMHDGKRGIVGL